ncbi:MAG: hypothetical protein WCI05_18235, partial [Myxococcales bacterium]
MTKPNRFKYLPALLLVGGVGVASLNNACSSSAAAQAACGSLDATSKGQATLKAYADAAIA